MQTSLEYANDTKQVTSTVPDGCHGIIVSDVLHGDSKLFSEKHCILYIARDDVRMQRLVESLDFFAHECEVIRFPAWDCLPYDRISPNNAVVSQRIKALSRLVSTSPKKRIIVTTINALLQRIVPKEVIENASLSIKLEDELSQDKLCEFLVGNGYIRTASATDPGEFAVRGGIVDVFAPGQEEGYRLDFFGDSVESIRTYDPMSQVTTGNLKEMHLLPASEIVLDEEKIAHFRKYYRKHFGAQQGDDPLYEAVSAGRKYVGMEHWLPLFYNSVDTLFDYVTPDLICTDNLVDEAKSERFALIEDYYQARKEDSSFKDDHSPAYNPVPADILFLTNEEVTTAIGSSDRIVFAQWSEEEEQEKTTYFVPNFSSLAKVKQQSSFSLLKEFLEEEAKKSKVFITCFTEGSRARMATMLDENDLSSVNVDSLKKLIRLKDHQIGLLVLPFEKGFHYNKRLFITEQDILGERIIRTSERRKRSENFLSEAASLTPGELVVHKENGIGRFEGLETITVQKTQHDCLRIIYDGGDKFFLPVENIDLVTRYGSEDELVKLDKLGGVAWQSRKAKLKKRIKIAAEALLKIAAERELKQAEPIDPMDGLYEEFCARFPYAETEDQLRSIEDVENDLASGKPMDRLICGDVGFGKTEVALRAAFLAVGGGKAEDKKTIQVAIVTPTTLLCRQHYKTFKERFKGFPVTVRQLSRMVTSGEATKVKQAIKEGGVDIVIGTHAILSKKIDFHNLGLLIIDEEQHFGVGQKERLKEMRGDVHVLSMSATPIPRTLQMSLTGIRDLSIIATPPVDRLAIRSYVMPFDPVVVREAILREHYRGGRTFYVCPRIKDLDEVEERIKKLVPEVKLVKAHGRMPPGELDEIMNAFYDGRFDVLLSTTIVESGLDIPMANTLVIHRADMYGLSQLYQIRGRVGRGKTRAYAYFTLPPRQVPTKIALKRLEVMQSLDSLGAGFSVASHDMDIRGFGNLVGDEQSGHIKEVGVELYQQMLKEAVESVKSQRSVEAEIEEELEGFSPVINLGISVLIPESYVEDLTLRLGLYRRVSDLYNEEGIESFAAELIDRFGAIPQEVENLLTVMRLKFLCIKANVAKIDSGPKGIVVGFHNDIFSHPEKLIEYSLKNSNVKLRGDQKMVVTKVVKSDEDKIAFVKTLLTDLVAMADAA